MKQHLIGAADDVAHANLKGRHKRDTKEKSRNIPLVVPAIIHMCRQSCVEFEILKHVIRNMQSRILQSKVSSSDLPMMTEPLFFAFPPSLSSST